MCLGPQRTTGARSAQAESEGCAEPGLGLRHRQQGSCPPLNKPASVPQPGTTPSFSTAVAGGFGCSFNTPGLPGPAAVGDPGRRPAQRLPGRPRRPWPSRPHADARLELRGAGACLASSLGARAAEGTALRTRPATRPRTRQREDPGRHPGRDARREGRGLDRKSVV